MKTRIPSPAMLVAIVAVVLSLTGAADAARNAIVAAINGHPVSSRPLPGGILLLGKNRKFPRSAIPSVGNARLLDGKTAEQVGGTCSPDTIDVGTYCIETTPNLHIRTESEKPRFNFIEASKACVKAGGYLPSASELIGAANIIKLESRADDNRLRATINEDPSRGLKDEREMSSTLVVTQGGPSFSGFEGVSEAAAGNPRQGQGNPVPLPANPYPETLQYVTVYSNFQKGGFAGSQPITEPQNFRCAFHLAQAGQVKSSE